MSGWPTDVDPVSSVSNGFGEHGHAINGNSNGIEHDNRSNHNGSAKR